jgi:hypothetical protein
LNKLNAPEAESVIIEIRQFLDSRPRILSRHIDLIKTAWYSAKQSGSPGVFRQLEETLRDVHSTPVERAVKVLEFRALDRLNNQRDRPFTLRGMTTSGETYELPQPEAEDDSVIVVIVPFNRELISEGLMKKLLKSYAAHRDRDVEFVGVSTEPAREDANRFVARNDVPWPVIHEVPNAENGIMVRHGFRNQLRFYFVRSNLLDIMATNDEEFENWLRYFRP